jgi:hypothetical protein
MKRITGRISTFGGPNDTGVSAAETCALYPTVLCRQLGTRLYTRHYCALRWDYAATAKALKSTRSEATHFIRTNPCFLHRTDQPNGPGILAHTADWGPAPSTGRLVDVSPTILLELDLQTDDNVIVELPDEVMLKP